MPSFLRFIAAPFWLRPLSADSIRRDSACEEEMKPGRRPASFWGVDLLHSRIIKKKNSNSAAVDRFVLQKLPG